MSAATWPYTTHYNTTSGRCFIEISTTWNTDGPFRNHTLEIVYDAIEGNEIAKMEKLTWFDKLEDATPREVFRLNGDEISATSVRLTDFRALMTK